MSGKGPRRSPRLTKLEEQRNNDIDACRLDPRQNIRNIISEAAHGKRKKNSEIQKLRGEASSSQAIDLVHTGKGPPQGEIIEHILETLELKDRHELFAMPDDIQACDYEERINRPGDFATLRQKNMDGMYKTLEQFENDVYMVFHKAISINSQDTIPYREAMSLMEQAKQVFLSLKSHLGPSEPGRVQQDGNDVGGSADIAAVAPAQQRPGGTPVKKKVAVPRGKGQQTSPRKKARNVYADKGKAKLQIGAREGKSTPSPVERAREAAAMATAAAAAEVVEPGDARVGKRRLTYNYDGDRDGGRTMMTPPPLTRPAWDRHATAVYANPVGLVQHPQVQVHTYQDSLRRFVRHAGISARLAAEFRSLECEDRARQGPSYWNGLATGAGVGMGGSSGYYLPSPLSMVLQTPPSGRSAVGEQAPALETDGQLKLAVPMVFRDTRGEGSSKGGHVARAGDDVAVTEAVAPAPTSSAGKLASTIDFGPFAPPKLAPSRLGFGQFGSFPPPFKRKLKPGLPPTPRSPGKKKWE